MASSRSLGTLTLDLVTKTAGFTGPLDKAGRDAGRSFDNIQRRAKQFAAVMSTALVSAAGLAANAIRQSINAMDDMSKAAQRAQIPTEQFSQLAYAGSLADVSMQDLTNSMGRLARAQGDAQRGLKTQADVFDKWNISIQNADGTLRNTREVFLDFADAFQKHQGSPEIMADGMQVFGRSFQNLIPLLKDGRQGLEDAADEADRLGITLSTEAGQQAEAFNDNLTRLKTGITGLWQAVASDLLPDLVNLSEQFLGTATDGDKLKTTAEGISSAIRETVGFVLDLHDRLVILRTEMARFELGAQKFSPGAAIRSLYDGEGLTGHLEQIVERQKELAAEADAARARILGRASPFARVAGTSGSTVTDIVTPETPRPTGTGGGGKSEAEKEAERLQAAYDSLNERLREQIALFGDSSQAAQVLYDIQNGELAKLAPRQQQELLGLAEKLDMMNEEKKVQDELNRINEQQEEAYQRVSAAIDEARLMVGMTREEQEIWNNLAWAGVDAESARGRAIIENTEALQRQREQMDMQAEAMDGLRDSARGFLHDIREGESVWDSLLNAVERFSDALFEVATDAAIKQLFGGQGEGGGGSWGDALGSWIGNLFGGNRASGGPVSAGRFYEVGENDRPELLQARNGKQYMIPGNDGTVVPMGRRGKQYGDQNNTFVVQGKMDKRSEDQIMLRLRMQQMQAVRNA